MSSRTIQINVKINYPVILFIIIFLHALALVIKGGGASALLNQMARSDERKPLQIQSIRKVSKTELDKIRTVGARESKMKDSVYLQKTNSTTKEISATKFSDNPGIAFKPNETKSTRKQPLSLSDLSMARQNLKNEKPNAAQATARPGTRPDLFPEKTKAINAISLKGSEIKQFLKSSDSTGNYASGGLDAASVSGDPRAQSLSNSDVMVNLEVPEGVNPDELNKYELMFYGFQRRTAINYVNTFYKNLDKFQSENPHLQFPMTETKQTMTGRITYDEHGNIKQIKMVRWSNVTKLQDFFVDVLKGMDTLHNPPQALWEKSGEFSIFFSLVING